MVPVMLCTAWENFKEELKATDNPRYTTHFNPLTKWHSEPIREIALIRHCIIHKNGKVDSNYLADSRLKTFNTAGFLIDFTDIELDLQFKMFEDAYTKIII